MLRVGKGRLGWYFTAVRFHQLTGGAAARKRNRVLAVGARLLAQAPAKYFILPLINEAPVLPFPNTERGSAGDLSSWGLVLMSVLKMKIR